MGQKHCIGNVCHPFMRNQLSRCRRIAQNPPAAQRLLPDEISALAFGEAVELAAQLGLHRFGNALGNRVSDDHATISPQGFDGMSRGLVGVKRHDGHSFTPAAPETHLALRSLGFTVPKAVFKTSFQD
jgi:hypothetical protein